MRHSEAIRKGAIGKYKVKDMLDDGKGGVCVVRARELGAGDGYFAGNITKIHCPACNRNESFFFAIMHMNNWTEMTLEEIATYVEQAELEQEERREPVPVPLEEVG